ncbi:MAG TPA: PaaI family thioesterase [Actinomycetota bacterium]|nr:PaaI family thioesterase [Actinomycetota bacterium]
MIVDEPIRGSFAYLEQPGLFGMPGVDQLQLFIERKLPAPPLTHLSGLVVDEASAGASTWSIPASEWWQTAVGVFAGGTLGFVADAALAGAVYTTLPKGMALLSSDLSINFLEPASPSSERLVARGTVIHAGRRQGLSEARVEDVRGTLLAHATSRCVLQPLPFDPPDPPTASPPVRPPRFDTPDPYLRPIQGEIVPQAVWDDTSGLDVAQLWYKGERPRAPNCSLLGLRFADVAEADVTLVMPASLWFCTGFGTFYGGAVTALADQAISTAVLTTLPPRTSFGTLDLKVNFLRPVTPDGRDLVARATVEQRGRTIAVTTCRVDDADGKRVAMATGSAMISPGRPWPTTGPALQDRPPTAPD